MKKLFLGTTVLAAGLVANVAMAGNGPKITIGGVSDFQAAVVEEDLLGSDKDVIFRNDNEIRFSIDGDYDGLQYGAVIELEADVSEDPSGSSSSSSSSGANAGRTYIYLQGENWGKLEFGSNDAASDTLKVDASSIARATGGIDGDFSNYIGKVDALVITPNLAMGRFNPLTLGDGGEESNKITYYTPNFEGFQAGLSFTPEAANAGQTIDGDFAENIFSLGIKYEGQFDDFGFAVSGNLDSGDAVDITGLEDIMAWQIGCEFDFVGFQLALSYADGGDSLMAKGSDIENMYYTAGLAYATNDFGVSATYLLAETDDGGDDPEFSNIVIGADYNLAPGILPYAEVAIIDDEKSDNDGTVFLIGTELTF